MLISITKLVFERFCNILFNSVIYPIFWTTVIMQLLNVIIVGDIIVIKFYCERM